MIAGTGSIDNTTGSMLGAFNIKFYDGPSIKMVTNQNMLIKSVFDFTGTITDQYGHEEQEALFKDFKFIPSAKYTLVAINKYLLKRWKLEGDSVVIITQSVCIWTDLYRMKQQQEGLQLQ